MRRLGLVAPMPSELAPLVKTLGLTRAGDDPYHRGRVGNLEVVAVRSGMGLERAERAARGLIEETDPEHVIVVGIAGGLGPSAVGSIVRPAVVVDRSARETFTATPLAEAQGVISSSDDFALSAELVAELVGDGVVAVDMETAAVARACRDRDVRWSAVRVISDLVSDHPDDAVLGLARPDGSPDPAAALRFVVRHPSRIPQLVRLGRDASRAARLAATEAARHVWSATGSSAS